MACETAQKFMALADEEQMGYDVLDENASVLRFSFQLENVQITVFMDFDEDNTNLHLDARGFLIVPEARKDNILRMCNEMNNKYRWFQFCYDNNQMLVKGDAVINPDTSADIGMELLMRVMRIINESYPELVTKLWE